MMVLKTEQYTVLVTLIIRKALTLFSFLSCGIKFGYSCKDIKEKGLLILDDSENSLEETNVPFPSSLLLGKELIAYVIYELLLVKT